MSIYKTKVFARFMRKEDIVDRDLCRAAAEVVEGRYDADLGGGVYKQRVARLSGGKSGGYRTILLFREGAHVFLRVRLREERTSQYRARRVEGVP